MPMYEDEMAAMQNAELEQLAGVGYISENGQYVGAAPTRKRVVGRQRIAVPHPGQMGTAVVWPLPCAAALTLAAAGTGNLTFTPNRNVSIRGIDLSVYTAAAITRAATYPEAIKVTSITVMGRVQFAGTGEVPVSCFIPEANPKIPIQMENCQSGQAIVIAFRNDDAATQHIVTGCIWVTTVK